MADHAHLKRQAISGVKWIGLSTAVTSAIQLIQVAVLARFLSPEDFGLMAMAMVVVGIAQAFNDMGISNAIIQRPDNNVDRLSSLFWLQIVAGLGLFLLMILITPLTAGFYNEAALTGVMFCISTIFLVTPPGQLFQSLLQKEMKFRALGAVDIIASIAGMIAAVIIAYAGLGVFALVIGQVLYYGLRSLLFVIAGRSIWKPRLHFKMSDLNGYMSFGMYQIGERVITYFSINVISLIIGRYMGADVLGHYSVAFQMTVYPILRVNNVIGSVAFPILSRIQDANDLLARGYLHITRAISFTVFPALAFAIVAAPALVPLLLGPGWSDVTVICQILCVVALFKVLGGAAVPAYLAKGRADLGFAWNLVIAIANGIVFYLAAGHGLIALTLSFAAVSMVQFVVLQTITGRIIGLKWNDYLGTIANDTAKSLVMGAVACVALTMGISSWEPVTLLSTVSLSSGAIFLAIELSFSRDYLLELWHLFFPAGNSRRARQE